MKMKAKKQPETTKQSRKSRNLVKETKKTLPTELEINAMLHSLFQKAHAKPTKNRTCYFGRHKKK